MSKQAHIQQSFDAGLLSARLAARDDLAKYHNGCSVLENFLPTVQGPLVRRAGTQFIAAADGNTRSWLIPFQVSERIAYMLEFAPHVIRVYTQRGVLLDNGAPVQITTPYSEADLITAEGTCAISVAQSADVMYLFCRHHAPQKLMRTSSTTFEIAPVALVNGPFDDTNADKTKVVHASATTSSVTLIASHDIFDAAHVGSLFYLQTSNLAQVRPWAVYQPVGVGHVRRVNHRVYRCTTTAGSDSEGGPVTGNQTPVHTEGRAWDGDGNSVANDSRGPIGVEWEFLHAGYGSVRIDNYVSSTEVTGTVVQRLPDDVVIATYTPAPVTYNIASIDRINGSLIQLFVPGYSPKAGDWVVLNGTLLKHGLGENFISIDGLRQISSVLTGIGSSGKFRIALYIPPNNNADTTGQQLGTLTTVPVATTSGGTPSHKWAHGLFSNANGWPEHGTFWRNRLALLRGSRLALSVAGDFENFSEKIDGEVQADASIVQRIAARQINRPTWMVDSSDDLVLGTNGDEWTIGPIQPNQALGPENIRAQRITAYGSRALAPVQIGGKILFASSSGRVLRDYEYSFDSDNYASHDLTRLSEDVLTSGAISMAWQKEPDNVLWLARADGALAACTLHQDPGVSDVYAWHLHRLVNGHVECVAAMPAPDGTAADLWLIVRRVIDGQTVRYVEILSRPLADDAAQSAAFYVDCALSYHGNPTTTLSGLEHLEGQTVQILADGAVHPERVVAAGGVTLDWPASVIHAGLPAPCSVATMGITAGSQNGTGQGKTKRITNMKVRMHRTLGGALGAERDKLAALDFRSAPMPMGSPPTLFTGEKNIVWPGGYETDARVWYVNDQPLPVTLLAFLPMVAGNDDR